jgi:hypothetical protein
LCCSIKPLAFASEGSNWCWNIITGHEEEEPNVQFGFAVSEGMACSVQFSL